MGKRSVFDHQFCLVAEIREDGQDRQGRMSSADLGLHPRKGNLGWRTGVTCTRRKSYCCRFSDPILRTLSNSLWWVEPWNGEMPLKKGSLSDQRDMDLTVFVLFTSDVSAIFFSMA
jgi:hypothetical protein